MAREFAVEIEWVPFELHPETPAEGYERQEQSNVARAGMRDRIYALAEEAGLPLQSNRIVANAHKSLEAAEWARAQGVDEFDTAHRALFKSYFSEARNISTTDQVVAAMEDTGLDMAALRQALEAGTYGERVDQMTAMARQNGIGSTPTFIFEDRFVVSGAQDFETFADFLTRIGVPRREGVEPGPLNTDPSALGEDLADPAAPADDGVISPEDIS